jgi:hypothetical protein
MLRKKIFPNFIVKSGQKILVETRLKDVKKENIPKCLVSDTRIMRLPKRRHWKRYLRFSSN